MIFSSIAQSEKGCSLLPSGLCIYLVYFSITMFLSGKRLPGHRYPFSGWDLLHHRANTWHLFEMCENSFRSLSSHKRIEPNILV